MPQQTKINLGIKINNYNMENWDLDRRKDKAHEALDDLVAEIETLEKEKEGFLNEIDNLNDEINALKDENDRLKDEHYQLKSQINDLTN